MYIQSRKSIFQSCHHAIDVRLRLIVRQLGLVVRLGGIEGGLQAERCHRVIGFRVFRDADSDARLLNLFIQVAHRAQGVASVDCLTSLEQSRGTDAFNINGSPVRNLHANR